VRLLFFMNNRRPLGTIDRQLFEQGKEMLASELALADGMEMTGPCSNWSSFWSRCWLRKNSHTGRRCTRYRLC